MQAKISKLRRALGDAAVVSGARSGYTLEVDPSAVDAVEVLELASAAKDRVRGGDFGLALQACDRALAMFRGDVILCDAGDVQWVVPYRVRLDEARLGLVEDQLSARLELGGGDELIGELEGLVLLHPLRERLWELLITALYRAGRQADALAAYRRVRTHLADDGLDPGLHLQQLEQQVLVQDVSLGVPDSTRVPSGLDVSAGNLPSMAAKLVGRESEVAVLSELLIGERLVEIVGPGGVGKTAVAIAVGRRLAESTDVGAGGVWLARLEAASTAHAVIDTVIAALNVPGGEAALFERLKGSAAVLILDNCEHVIDEATSLAVRLLDAAPEAADPVHQPGPTRR